ncbi:MAG: hypothetical protein QXU99_06490 [Candidatus Bathyarchaeia archaeon]
MKRQLLLALFVSLLCCIVAVAVLIYPALNPPNQPKILDSAITKAINYIKDTREPYALLWLDAMYRRFQIAEFADAIQKYDEEITNRPSEASILRVFRRIADHNNQLHQGDLQAVTFDTDRVTVPALYCDRFGLPDDYAATLEREANRGGYYLTHVLLALIWIEENGCEPPVPNEFIQNIYQSTAALIGVDPVVEDLELEAAAFLYLAGRGDLVSNAFIDRVIEAQNDDGGWTRFHETPGNSDWHATVLGLFILLHVKYPANSYPPMLNPAPV